MNNNLRIGELIYLNDNHLIKVHEREELISLLIKKYKKSEKKENDK